MAIVTRHPLYLTGLRFPRDLRVTVSDGALTLHNEIARKKVTRGESFVVPAFLRFACDVMPGSSRRAVFSLALEADGAPHWGQLGKRWSRALARQVFNSPQEKWSAARLAALWQVTPHKAQGRLFAEGESLLSLVREQRLAHALLAAAHRDGAAGQDLAALAADSGFASVPALSHACTEIAGIEPGIFLSTL